MELTYWVTSLDFAMETQIASGAVLSNKLGCCKGNSLLWARRDPKFIKYNSKYNDKHTWARRDPKRKL